MAESANSPAEAPRCAPPDPAPRPRSEEHTSELQSQFHLVCRLLLEKKKVVGEEDVGVGDFGAVVGHVAVFAEGGGLADRVAAAFVFHDLFVVQPMLDVIALDADAGMVPRTGRMQRFGAGRRDSRVAGGGAGLFVARPAVVEQVVFVAGGARVRSDDLFHTAVFFFNDTAPTEIYTLSLHDALPILCLNMMFVMGGNPQFRHRGDTIGAMAGAGTFAEYTIVPQQAAVKIDSDIPLEVAALIEIGRAHV